MTIGRAVAVGPPRGSLQAWSDVLDPAVLVVPAAQHEETVHAVGQVLAAATVAARDFHAMVGGSFAEIVGLGSATRDLVPADWDEDSTAYCRVDYVIGSGGPRVVELNFGTSAGGALDVEALAGAAATAGLRSPGRPNEARMKWVARRARELDAHRVLIPTWPWGHFQDPAEYLASVTVQLQARGLDVDLVPLARLRETIGANDVVLKLFSSQDALANGVDLTAIGLHPGSGVRWLCGEFATALSAKTLMALPAMRGGAAATYLSPTAVLGDTSPWFASCGRAEALERKDELVLKPAGLLGGRGVVAGCGVSSDEWADAIGQAEDGESIVQQVQDSEPVDTLEGPATAVWGTYFVEGVAQGTLLRYRPGVDSRAIVSGHLGARLGAVVVPND